MDNQVFDGRGLTQDLRESFINEGPLLPLRVGSKSIPKPFVACSIHAGGTNLFKKLYVSGDPPRSGIAAVLLPLFLSFMSNTIKSPNSFSDKDLILGVVAD